MNPMFVVCAMQTCECVLAGGLFHRTPVFGSWPVLSWRSFQVLMTTDVFIHQLLSQKARLSFLTPNTQ